MAAGKFLREMQKQGVVRNDISLPFLIHIFEGAIFFPILTRVSKDVFSKKLHIESNFIEIYSDAVTKILSN